MQEQPQYKISPDQGWSQMMHILAKELPVARRTRRIMIMWWSVAAVATASLISIFSLLKNEQFADPVISAGTAIEKSEAPTHTNPSLEITDQSPTSVTENTPDHYTEAKPSSNVSSPRKTFNNAIITDGSISSDELRKVNSTSETGHLSSEFAESNSVVIVQSDPGENNIMEVTPDAHATDQSTAVDHAGAVVGFLPLTDIDLSDEFSLPSIQPLVSPSVPRRELFEASVNLGVKEGYFGGLGMHGGVGLDVNITPRFSFTTEVGLNIYEPDVSFLWIGSNRQTNTQSADLLEEDFSNGIGTYLPSYAVHNSTGNAISPFIEAILQWQVSAGAKYQLSKRFCVEGGVAFGFGTTSRSEYPIVEVSYSGPLSGDNFYIRNSFDSYQVLEPNMTSVYGGIGYKPGNKIEIFAHWTHSFDHYLINHPAPLNESLYERTDYIRGLSLGLKYIL